MLHNSESAVLTIFIILEPSSIAAHLQSFVTSMPASVLLLLLSLSQSSRQASTLRPSPVGVAIGVTVGRSGRRRITRRWVI